MRLSVVGYFRMIISPFNEPWVASSHFIQSSQALANSSASPSLSRPSSVPFFLISPRNIRSIMAPAAEEKVSQGPQVPGAVSALRGREEGRMELTAHLPLLGRAIAPRAERKGYLFSLGTSLQRPRNKLSAGGGAAPGTAVHRPCEVVEPAKGRIFRPRTHQGDVGLAGGDAAAGPGDAENLAQGVGGVAQVVQHHFTVGDVDGAVGVLLAVCVSGLECNKTHVHVPPGGHE